MKGNIKSNTWHTAIEFILYIVAEFKLIIYTQIIWEKGLAVGLVGAPITLKLP